MCGMNPCDKPECTWGEAHRKRCEAKTILSWPKSTRLAYVADVKKKRGERSAQELIDEATALWTASRGIVS